MKNATRSVLILTRFSNRFSQSVQHIKVSRLKDGKYQFGQSMFANEDTLRRHFEQEKPIIGGENSEHSKQRLSFLSYC